MTHHARERGELGAAVLTISTSRARGDGVDESGPALVAFAERLGAQVVGTEVIPDERELIEGRLRWWSDQGGCELVLTTGGTGFAPDDVTPEATRAVIEREAPGIAEAMRAASREHTRLWMVSRGIAGTRGRTLIVNFPGNPPAIEQAGAGIAEAIPHALSLLSGARRH
jgi:molybdenum cofactor synthesis domain-containing protein